jgi:hypothetical protein
MNEVRELMDFAAQIRKGPQSVKKVEAKCHSRDGEVAFGQFSASNIHHWLGDFMNVCRSPSAYPRDFMNQLELENIQFMRVP